MDGRMDEWLDGWMAGSVLLYTDTQPWSRVLCSAVEVLHVLDLLHVEMRLRSSMWCLGRTDGRSGGST